MITLKDYLGTIVSSVNNARGMADEASAKLAKQYAEDDVLQFYTVPRMRMQDVELEIPLGIESFNTKENEPYEPIDNNSFYSKTYTVIKDVYEVNTFNKKTSIALSQFLKKEIQHLENQLKKEENTKEQVHSFSKNIVEKSMNLIRKNNTTKPTKINENPNELKSPNSDQFLNLLNNRLIPEIKPRLLSNKIEDANVVVESDKLSTIPQDKLIKIKMKIMETGMEWHHMEDANGEVKSKLVSE